MVASSNSGVALWQHTAESPQWLPVSLLEAAGFEQGKLKTKVFLNWSELDLLSSFSNFELLEAQASHSFIEQSGN